MSRELKERLFLNSLFLLTTLSLLIIASIILVIFINGAGSVTLEFLFTESRDFGAEGGIFYQITGSLLIVGTAALLTFPIALGTAICSSEFIKNSRMKSLTLTLIYGLNGVPSIIFGVFGLIFFVNFLKMGISWFVGSIVLGMMILPTMLVAALGAMESIPQSYRESALSLGMDNWKMVTSVIIPQSFPGALSGLFLGLSRAIGETAPIMFIATAFSGVLIPASIFEPVSTLSTHILALSSQAVNPKALANAWGAAVVLITLVFVFSLSSFFARVNMKKGGIR